MVDFLELLKDRFRTLDFVRLSRCVVTSNITYGLGYEGMAPMVQAIFRQHGLADHEHCLEECLDAVYRVPKEEHPGQER